VPDYNSILVLLFLGATGALMVGGLMKVFGEKPAFRIVLGGIAILLPPLADCLAEEWRMSSDAAGWISLASGAVGWICLGFYRSTNRVGKWTLFAFYPILVWITAGIVDISINGFHVFRGF
jgi:hypothetical protein